MQRGLMAEDGWKELGLMHDHIGDADAAAQGPEQGLGKGLEEGGRASFVAGAKVARRRRQRGADKSGKEDATATSPPTPSLDDKPNS